MPAFDEIHARFEYADDELTREDTWAPRGVDDIIGLEVAAVLTGTGPSVYLLNRLYRDDDDGEGGRDREGAARRDFDEHARWPDEQASDASARSERRA